MQNPVILALLLCSSCLDGVSTSLRAADSNEPTDKKPIPQVQQALEMINIIMDQHIAPPSKQEMILQIARALHLQADGEIPADLSRRVSSLTTDEEFAQLLLQGSFKSIWQNPPTLQTPAGTQLSPIQTLAAILSPVVPGGLEVMDGNEARVQDQVSANRYVGIGIALGQEDGVPVIQRMFYEGPGYKAGVRAQDSILEIDDESTSGKSLAEVVTALRGEDGSDVKLVLQQPDQTPRTITVTRGVTFIPTVEGVSELMPGKWEFMTSSNREYAVLRIRQIGPSTVHELKKIERQLRQEPNLSGLVLDIREGSGILHDTILVADAFLEEGTIARARNREGVAVHEAESGSLFQDLPIAIVLSAQSGADRQLLAHALIENGRARLVGTPPTLAPLVRSRIPLADGSRLTMATGVLESTKNSAASLSANLRHSGRSPLIAAETTDVVQNTYASSEIVDQPIQQALEFLQNVDSK